MRANCKCCGRHLDLRMGYCFDCVEAESIIVDGLDMHDNEIKKEEGMSTAMSRLKHILKNYVNKEIVYNERPRTDTSNPQLYVEKFKINYIRLFLFMVIMFLLFKTCSN